MCGFGYLNGGLQIATAQCFLIVGSFFSVASLGDCSFVKIDSDLKFVLGPTKTSNTFGYLTFEDAFDGRCYWYDDGGATSQQQIESYWDFLGSDFNLTRIFAMIAAGGGWLQFLYSVTLCCSSHKRHFRDLQFFLVSIVLTLFQGLTLLIFNSDFCEEYTCTFGRSAGFSGAACACYFMAGAMYRAMSDYPGDEFVDRSNTSTGERSLSQHGQENFHDEGSAASSFQRESSTSYPDSSDEEKGQMSTPQTSNANEAPNVLEAPLESSVSSQMAANTVDDDDDDEESKPDDDETAPSVTSIYMEDAASATQSNDESALGPPMDEEEAAEAATFVDEYIEEIIEEVVEESETEVEEIIEEEMDGESLIVMEEGEPSESEGAPVPPAPVASKPQAQPEGEFKAPEAGAAEAPKDPLSAPQPPSESPAKEEHIPKTAEEVADDASDDPIFE